MITWIMQFGIGVQIDAWFIHAHRGCYDRAIPFPPSSSTLKDVCPCDRITLASTSLSQNARPDQTKPNQTKTYIYIYICHQQSYSQPISINQSISQSIYHASPLLSNQIFPTAPSHILATQTGSLTTATTTANNANKTGKTKTLKLLPTISSALSVLPALRPTSNIPLPESTSFRR